MVAETREGMTKMADCMADSFRTAFDAGRRTQDTFFKAITDMWRQPSDMGCMNMGGINNERGERVMREWVPFVGKTMEAFAQTCDTTFRAGTDVFKAGVDVAAKGNEADPYESSRQVFDATFSAVRHGFDAFGKAGAKTMENCTTFCDAIFRGEPTRPVTTPGKGGKVNA